MQNTLWPETHKLYGHGYEVFALDASPDGCLLASACRATMPEHAATLIWYTPTRPHAPSPHPLTTKPRTNSANI
jgi:hypothetical protein